MAAGRKSVEVRVHETPAAFLAEAGPLLRAEEARNSLLLGIADRLEGGGAYGDEAPLLLTLHRDGACVGAALQTPPWPLLLSPLEETACDDLVDWLLERGASLPGVNADRSLAERFCQRFTSGTGLGRQLLHHTRLFELREVVEPPPPGGRMRLAASEDRELVAAWYDAFHAEATPEAPKLGPDRQLEAGKVWLWVDAEEEPVCLATRNREQPTGASIGPVYTPPERRGRGYGTALVAALSQAILDDGKEYVSLFTNLANPTSNAIYPRVGYRPIADMSAWLFMEER